MKKTILLTLILLCLGCAIPFASYQLSISTFARGTEQVFPNALPHASAIPTPNASLHNESAPPFPGSEAANSNAQSALPTPLAPSSAAVDSSKGQLAPFLIQDERTGDVLTVSVRDYLIGAVASELPITWPDAALQAQAIAAHSYVLYCKENADTAALNGAYLSADPTRRQGFMTDAVLHSYWGTNYASYYERLSALVDAVLDIIVCYDGSAAATSYFSISNGQTESSEDVWGQALPYLVSVDSSADCAADGFSQSVCFTAEQVVDALTVSLGISPSGYTPETYFQNFTYTSAGYVDTAEVCGLPISGLVLRNIFALRSSCFTVSYEDNQFTFTTLGYGHGVGLSQWGAKLRADEGETWQAILAHYYPHTTLSSALAYEKAT